MKNMMKFMLGAAVLAAAGSLAAQEFTFNKAADWKKSKLVSDGDGVLEIKSQAMMTSGQKFDVDPEKTYTVKFSVCAPDAVAKKLPWVLGGFAVYDKTGRPISCIQDCVVAKTLTEVTADAKKGDSVLMVKDGSKFKKSAACGVVVGAKEDLSDLPNRNIVASGIKNIEQKGDAWEITTIRPLVKDVKAGTSVRLHSAGGYIYTAGSKLVGKNWVTMSGNIKGMRPGSWNGAVWPAGAAKAEFIILANWNGQKTPVQIKDVTLTIK